MGRCICEWDKGCVVKKGGTIGKGGKGEPGLLLFLWAEAVVGRGEEKEKEKHDGIHVVIIEEERKGFIGKRRESWRREKGEREEKGREKEGREWVGFFRRVERSLKLLLEGEGVGEGEGMGGVKVVVPLDWGVKDWCEMGVCFFLFFLIDFLFFIFHFSFFIFFIFFLFSHEL